MEVQVIFRISFGTRLLSLHDLNFVFITSMKMMIKMLLFLQQNIRFQNCTSKRDGVVRNMLGMRPTEIFVWHFEVIDGQQNMNLKTNGYLSLRSRILIYPSPASGCTFYIHCPLGIELKRKRTNERKRMKIRDQSKSANTHCSLAMSRIIPDFQFANTKRFFT